jgi:hypothetical protein
MWDWDSLKGFNLRRWWITAIAVGAIFTVAAIAIQNPAATLVGLGIVAMGFGEWMNHPIPMEIDVRKAETLTTIERENHPLGVTIDVIGIALFILGIIALVRAVL